MYQEADDEAHAPHATHGEAFSPAASHCSLTQLASSVSDSAMLQLFGYNR